MPVSALSLPAGHVITAAEAARIAEATQPWATYTPTISGVTTSSVSARYLRHGDLVTVKFRFTLSGAPTGAMTVSLPANAETTMPASITFPYGTVIGSTGGALRLGAVVYFNTGTVSFVSDAGVSSWSAGVPIAWGSGNVIAGTFTYEAA